MGRIEADSYRRIKEGLFLMSLKLGRNGGQYFASIGGVIMDCDIFSIGKGIGSLIKV